MTPARAAEDHPPAHGPGELVEGGYALSVLPARTCAAAADEVDDAEVASVEDGPNIVEWG